MRQRIPKVSPRGRELAGGFVGPSLKRLKLASAVAGTNKQEEAVSEQENKKVTAGVLLEVATERARQDALWGEQNHSPFVYLAIASEELGEASQAALKAIHEGGKTLGDYRDELIQVAASAVAAVECLDRGKWRNPLPVREVIDRWAAEATEASYADTDNHCLLVTPSDIDRLKLDLAAADAAHQEAPDAE